MTAPPTIQRCISAAAAEFGIGMHAMLYADRHQPTALARQVAMWLAHCLTTKSHAQIGRALAGRDGSTVRHGIRRLEALRAEDAALRARVDRIRDSLKSQKEAA